MSGDGWRWSEIFDGTPTQWDDQAGPVVWGRLQSMLEDQSAPRDEAEAARRLHDGLGQVVGVDPATCPERSLRQASLGPGGTPGEQVALDSWQQRLLPLLVSRAAHQLRGQRVNLLTGAELVEREALRSFAVAGPYGRVPHDVDVDVPPHEAFYVVSSSALPRSPMLNRVAGLGILGSATEAQLAGALEKTAPGATRRVELSPLSPQPGRDPDLERMRLARTDTVLVCRLGTVDTASTGDVTTEPAREGDREALGVLYREVFGTDRWAGAVGAPHWDYLIVRSGDRILAAGALFTEGPWSWLAWGATSPAARHLGLHRSVLAARLQLAQAAGARHAAVVVNRDANPRSYANIVSAGFRPAYTRQVYEGRR